MINHIDIVGGLSFGDEGKGAVAHSLASKHDYNLVVRTNGGHNAGHTIFHKKQKYVTHIVPCGIFHGKTSLIGNGCVLNEKKFLEEVESLVKSGFDESLIKIASNTHIITDKHLKEEEKESKIGTTKQGNGPAYRDKYDRKGIRAESVKSLQRFIVDSYQLLHDPKLLWGVLVEGAQGFYLDIDHGTYPYVTSSHTTTAGACLNMLPVKKINKVYGCLKAYDTYVGSNKFQPEDGIFDEIAELGQEFGSTTGRKRQINWLNLDMARKAKVINESSYTIVSKLDVMKELNKRTNNENWKVIDNGQVVSLGSEQKFKEVIINKLGYSQFRESPEESVVI